MDFLAFLDRYGLPLAVLVFFVSCVVLGMKAIWRDLVIPFRDRVLKRLDKLFDAVDVIEEVVRKCGSQPTKPETAPPRPAVAEREPLFNFRPEDKAGP